METQSELIERKVLATRQAALRRYADALLDGIAPRAVTVVGGDHDGAVVLSEKSVRELIASVTAEPLPPTDVQSAEVVTPAIVFVDDICPSCKESARITAAISSELRVTAKEGELHIKVKASKASHTCGQRTMIEADEPDEPDADVVAAIAEAEAIANSQDVPVEEAPPDPPTAIDALPRAECPVCGQSVPVRRNGALREHRVRKPQLEQEPEKGIAGTHTVCRGSGYRPEDLVADMAGEETAEKPADGCPYPGCLCLADHTGDHEFEPEQADLPPDPEAGA